MVVLITEQCFGDVFLNERGNMGTLFLKNSLQYAPETFDVLSMNVIRYWADEVFFMYNDFVAVSEIANFIIRRPPVANNTGPNIYMPDNNRHQSIPTSVWNDNSKRSISALPRYFGSFNTSKDPNLLYQSSTVVLSL